MLLPTAHYLSTGSRLLWFITSRKPVGLLKS